MPRVLAKYDIARYVGLVRGTSGWELIRQQALDIIQYFATVRVNCDRRSALLILVIVGQTKTMYVMRYVYQQA